MSKICPVCETSNEPGAKHCEVCGERLPIPQAAPVDGPAPAPAPLPPAVASLDPSPVIAAPTPEDIAETLPTSFDDQRLGGTAEQASQLESFEQRLADALTDPPSLDDLESKRTIPELAPVFKVGPGAPAPDVELAPMPKLVIYQNKQPVHAHPINQDETLIGRYDPTSDAYPDLDLTDFDPGRDISRKHTYLYRQGGRFYVCPISNAGTQVGATIVDLGQRHEIESGAVIILAGAVAMKFEIS